MTRRPSFAKNYPPAPELEVLVEAFGRGDHALVRDRAHRLSVSSEDPAVKEAVRELLARTRPDPLAIALTLFAGALLLVLGGFWMTYGKAPASAAPPITAAPK
ncbi:MAG: hypothetical protein ABSC94_04500 [Polyangiaceae bacterium]|jgi:hypothetical protein